MNVTKCDCCGKILANEDAFKVDLAYLKARNNKTERLCRMEICDTCKDAVLVALTPAPVEPDVEEPTPDVEQEGTENDGQ